MAAAAEIEEVEGRKTKVRVSVTFSGESYRILEDLARVKKVSLAWVVRDAVDRYIDDQDQTPAPKASGRREGRRD